MIFISLLIFATLLIASSAAFFSVWGLAVTFSGTFWSVVLMGTSLELGKLVATSYLYRYWTKTTMLLKAYLITGVLALMILTSSGIFGYLSNGYSMDILPLKQTQTQVQLLDEEKARLLDRKKQIDTQIAQLPTNSVKGRERLIKGFKVEQKDVTNRISALDKETLELKQKLITTEAHIGPITYIAKAFDLDTDNATQYLIYLIIFAFDPMAIALTIAVNNALRIRKEEQFPLKQPQEIQLGFDTYQPDDDFKPYQPEQEVTPPTHSPPRAPNRVRPYAGSWSSGGNPKKVADLIAAYSAFAEKLRNGIELSTDEQWELDAIKAAMKSEGYGSYLD